MKVSARIHVAGPSSDPFNEVLRTVVEGRIPWRFLPPSELSSNESNSRNVENGIWLPEMTDQQVSDGRSISDDESDKQQLDSDIEDAGLGTEDSDATADDADSREEDTPKRRVIGVQSRFAALDVQ